MSFGQNLQFLRKMRNKMSQEELAEKMGVSRQTISKWELDNAYPEMDKVLELCTFFSCSMDQLIREDMNVPDEAYSDIRIEQVEPFRYISYAVISADPETDAIGHVSDWAKQLGMDRSKIIGWDFPVVSQEQNNVFHMHGYAAALVLDENTPETELPAEVNRQEKQKYIAVTIGPSSQDPFRVIPGAYQLLLAYMKTNGIGEKHDKAIIPCFEREYEVEGVWHMDVYIAIE